MQGPSRLNERDEAFKTELKKVKCFENLPPRIPLNFWVPTKQLLQSVHRNKPPFSWQRSSQELLASTSYSHKPEPLWWSETEWLMLDRCPVLPDVTFPFSCFICFLCWSGKPAAATPESLIRIDETQGECGKSLWLQPLGKSSGDFLIFLHMLKIPRSPLTERRFKRAVFLSSFLWRGKYIYIYKDEDSHCITSSEQADVIKRLFSWGQGIKRVREQLEITHFSLPTHLKCSHK